MTLSESTPDEFENAPEGQRWVLFAPLAAFTLAGATGMAVLLHLAYQNGFYFVIMLPMIASLLVCWLVFLTIQVSHCRSRWLAGSVGLVAGLILSLGFYLLGLVAELGPGNPDAIFRIDLLPEYIANRKATEVVLFPHQLGRVVHAQHPPVDQFLLALNWFYFAIEFGVVVWLTTTMGIKTSQQPYCKRCHGWRKRHYAYFVNGSGPALAEALETGNTELLMGLVQQVPDEPTSRTSVELERCPLREGVGTCSVHLTSREISPRNLNPLAWFGGPRWEIVINQRPLNDSQMAMLVERFPFLKDYILTELPREFYSDASSTPSGELAVIEPMQDEFRGKILTPRARIVVELFSAAPLAALPLLFLFITIPGIPKPLATICLMASFCVFFIPYNRLSDWHMRSRATAEFRGRPDALVDPDTPGVFFVEMVPRSNQALKMPDRAYDVGFLLINLTNREIRFEGDQQRFRIPASAVKSCHLEKAVKGYQHYAVLRVNTAKGPWEASLALRQGGSLNDIRRAQKIHDAVRQLLTTAS